MKMPTATRFTSRLKNAVSTTESGITSRGNSTLRTRFSWSSTDVTAALTLSDRK